MAFNSPLGYKFAHKSNSLIKHPKIMKKLIILASVFTMMLAIPAQITATASETTEVHVQKTTKVTVYADNNGEFMTATASVTFKDGVPVKARLNGQIVNVENYGHYVNGRYFAYTFYAQSRSWFL